MLRQRGNNQVDPASGLHLSVRGEVQSPTLTLSDNKDWVLAVLSLSEETQIGFDALLVAISEKLDPAIFCSQMLRQGRRLVVRNDNDWRERCLNLNYSGNAFL